MNSLHILNAGLATQEPNPWDHTKSPLIIGECVGGVRTTVMKPLQIEWDDLVAQFKNPEVGNKDGSYITRCPFKDGCRHAESQLAGYLLILDGDSSVDTQTGEILIGAPDPQIVHDFLYEQDLTHLIYSSHSNQQGGKGHRYRLLIPVYLENQWELDCTVTWLLEKIQLAGIPLADVKENHAFAQAWYRPRVPSEEAREKFVFLEHTGSEPFPLPEAREWYQLKKERQDKVERAIEDKTEVYRAVVDSPISRFNLAAKPKDIHTLLVSNGYMFCGVTGIEDRRIFRYLCPGSKSQSPGVTLFKDHRGTWRVHSFHGDEDPLSARSQDAFGLLTLFKYNGNFDAALAAAIKKMAVKDERTLEGEKFTVVDLSELMTTEPKPPEFIIEPIVPRREATMLGGHGGSGKSYLSMVLGCHVACGYNWGPFKIAQGRVCFISMEDSTDILKYRLRQVIEVYGLPANKVLDNLLLVDATNVDFLAEEVRDKSVARLQYREIGKQVLATAKDYDLMILDNASDAYGANENERRLVRAFIRYLTRLMKDWNGAIILLAHIDKASARGDSRGNSYSGSTAWHNSARSRLALMDGELIHEKSNHGTLWPDRVHIKPGRGGVPLPVDADEWERIAEMKRREAQEALLMALQEAVSKQILIPTATSGPKTMWKVLQGLACFASLLKPHGKKALDSAAKKLEEKGFIETTEITTPSRNKKQIWILAETSNGCVSS